MTNFETESEDFAFDGSGVALAEPELAVEQVTAPKPEADQSKPDVLEQVPKPAWQGKQPVEGAGKAMVYFDLETAADEERLGLFGLPEIQAPPPETPYADCLSLTAMLSMTVEAAKAELARIRPPQQWLDELEAGENAKPKPRQGVLDLVRAARQADPTAAYQASLAERRKLLATTPEFCRVVAIGWAVEGRPPQSLFLEPHTEVDGLKFLWRLFCQAQPVVGFNVLHFDLPVLFARSAILGVPSSRTFDMKLWGRDVVDLFAVRFPKGPGAASGGRPAKLKELARVYGVPVPAGDVDGGDVERLVWEDPQLLRQYVESDVEITRALHRKWAGYFC